MNFIIFILTIICITSFSLMLLYPLWSFSMAKIASKKVAKSDCYEAPVSIIICCYNEAEYIKQRISFFLDEKEWIAGSELIIVSDGSIDGTNEILRSYEQDDRVNLFIFEDRKHKIAGINFAFRKCKNDILIFSDCRQEIKSGSVKEIVRNFNDLEIGTVTSTLVDTKNTKKPSLIRNILKKTALNDSKYGSCLNVYGALYAQRKTIFRPIPNELLFDDLFVVISTVSQGKRLIQEPKAIIYDLNFKTYYQKERIRRLARGLLNFMHYQYKLIFSCPFPFLVRFLVFKYIKLFTPLLLIWLCLMCIPFLLNVRTFTFFIGILSVLMMLKPFRQIVYYFFQFNYHFLASIFHFVRQKNRSNTWEKVNFKTNKPV